MYRNSTSASRNVVRNSASGRGSGHFGVGGTADAAWPASGAPWWVQVEALCQHGPARLSALFAAPEAPDTVPAARALALRLDALAAEGRVAYRTLMARAPADGEPAARAFAAGVQAAALARHLNLDPAERRAAVLAALLHDVGETLLPPGVDPGTHAVHAAVGADLLGGAATLGAGVDAAIRLHHERFDGRGTPFGLAGAAIPLAARMLAALDALGPGAPGESGRPGGERRHRDPGARLEALGRDPGLDPCVVAGLVGCYARADDLWRP